jgi:hypothetical protein
VDDARVVRVCMGAACTGERRQSGTWATPSRWRERARSDAQKLAMCVQILGGRSKHGTDAGGVGV